jgi:anti-sigma factor RsiW
MSATEDHDALWSDRLLAWVDGDLDAADAAQFEAHRAGCALCERQLRDLAQLDVSLRAALPPIALDESFDKRLFARIDTLDENQRTAARQRAEQEFQQNLQGLARGWKRTLGLVIPGVICGIALAFAVTGWFHGVGVTQNLVVEGTRSVMGIDGMSTASSGDMATLLRLALTTVLGAGIGTLVARWLATAAD